MPMCSAPSRSRTGCLPGTPEAAGLHNLVEHVLELRCSVERMDGTLQASLLDLAGEPGPGPLDGMQRTELGRGAWIDVLPGWLTGADELFGRLLKVVPWRAERRQMYDRVVDGPRLLCFYSEDEELPDPLLIQAREALDEHYEPELGERFATAGLCLYRDGRDSVAWHGDTIGRGSSQDTIV